MTTDPLLIPLAILPPLPVGAPLVDVEHDADPPRGCLLCGYSEGGYLRIAYYGARPWSGAGCEPAHYALDLRPPDPPGSRVDGLDVGLRLLGWKPGMVATLVGARHWIALGARIWTPTETMGAGAERPPVPALASIDPADPLALRLAVAEVLRDGRFDAR